MTEWDSETDEWYANNYGKYVTKRLAVDELDLRHDSEIVDVGCGTETALRHVASKVSGGILIGIDPITRMIEIARERSADHPAVVRIEYPEGSVEDLPLNSDLAH